MYFSKHSFQFQFQIAVRLSVQCIFQISVCRVDLTLVRDFCSCNGRNRLQIWKQLNGEGYWFESSWNFTRKCHPHVEPLLGSYNNRIHNFELAMVSLVILYIHFLSTKSFPILKLKNLKRVCPKIKIKGQKERKRSKK